LYIVKYIYAPYDWFYRKNDRLVMFYSLLRYAFT